MKTHRVNINCEYQVIVAFEKGTQSKAVICKTIRDLSNALLTRLKFNSTMTVNKWEGQNQNITNMIIKDDISKRHQLKLTDSAASWTESSDWIDTLLCILWF